MKIIFLDVDGVLNTPKLLKRFGFDFIDPILVALVARIVKETEAKIVLSSTWRIEEKNKEMVRVALAEHGLEIFDCTPVITKSFSEGGWTRRHEEIQSWIDQNTVTKFAIIDDFDDANIEGSFFQTDENIGLTVSIAENIIRHFNTF